jgi:hypothetical protein
MLRTRLLLPAAVTAVAALAATAGSASADTYCVHQADSCPAGTTDSGTDLVGALAAAASSPIADTVQIGAGTFTAPAGGFLVAGTSPLTVVGSGAATVLDGPAPTLVALQGGAKQLSAVAVHVAPQIGAIGVAATGPSVISDVQVTGSAGNLTGVNAAGAVTISGLQVAVSGANATGVFASAYAGAAPTLRDSAISAPSAFYAMGGGSAIPFTVQRVFATGGGLTLTASGAVVNVDDSVVHAANIGSPPLVAQCPGIGGSATLHADHLTVVGDGGGTAIQSTCGTAGDSATVDVTNSTIRQFAKLTYRSATGGGTADVAVSWSDVAFATNGDSGPGAVTAGPGIMTVTAAGFVGAGDERLTAASPLIDAGNPMPAAFALDRDGLARVSGGRQDIGAYEHQAPAPAASGSSGIGTTGGAADGPAADAGSQADAGASAATPQPAAPVASRPSAVRLRALLLRAIRSGDRSGYVLDWPVAGRATFEWRIRGRVVARGSATRTTTGRGRILVKPTHRLPRHAVVTVRATFTPAGGRTVSVRARATR